MAAYAKIHKVVQQHLEEMHRAQRWMMQEKVKFYEVWTLSSEACSNDQKLYPFTSFPSYTT